MTNTATAAAAAAVTIKAATSGAVVGVVDSKSTRPIAVPNLHRPRAPATTGSSSATPPPPQRQEEPLSVEEEKDSEEMGRLWALIDKKEKGKSEEVWAHLLKN